MLRNLDWTKATINGKKAGFVVYNDSIWMLSYIRQWDVPESANYDNVPNHSFFRKICVMSENCYTDWNDFRSNFRQDNLFRRLGIESIYFPGEEGFERNIVTRRRRSERASSNTETTTTTNAVPSRDAHPEIDFYLPNYTTRNIYQGRNQYHTSHTRDYMNTPVNAYNGYRIGVELEVVANSNELILELVSKKSNWFTRERDSSIGNNGIEYITIPLLPEDAKSYGTWHPLCESLKNKAKSWDTGVCGLHVHIGREILGITEDEKQLTLGKLLIFYQSDIEHWLKGHTIFGRQRCYNQADGEIDEIKAVKCLGKDVLKEQNVYNKVDQALKERFNQGRYFAVNLTNSATIEFRKGKGSINPDRIIAVITFVESICLFCKETSPAELTIENFINWIYSHVGCGNPIYRYLGATQPDR